MPSTQQWAYFLAFLAAGMVFMAIAFIVFLPLIIVAPGKFAITFTLGSALVMGGFAALRGFKQQAMHMISRERLPFSACESGPVCVAVALPAPGAWLHAVQLVVRRRWLLLAGCVIDVVWLIPFQRIGAQMPGCSQASMQGSCVRRALPAVPTQPI